MLGRSLKLGPFSKSRSHYHHRDSNSSDNGGVKVRLWGARVLILFNRTWQIATSRANCTRTRIHKSLIIYLIYIIYFSYRY